jgi:hypothetical protein
MSVPIHHRECRRLCAVVNCTSKNKKRTRDKSVPDPRSDRRRMTRMLSRLFTRDIKFNPTDP